MIDIAHANPNGRIDFHNQTYGVVISANATDGVIVLEHATNKRMHFPPNFRSWKQLEKATYRIPGTDEIVRNPGFESRWVKLPDTGQLSPASLHDQTPKSAYHNIYGIGTTLYGRDEKQSDGSYVTTKWVILFFVPIIPLGSFRIFSQTMKPTLGTIATKHFAIAWPLNKKQVVKAYSVTLIAVITIFFIVSAQYNIDHNR